MGESAMLVAARWAICTANACWMPAPLPAEERVSRESDAKRHTADLF
ncbi:MAG: hypothetical protein R2881_06400 [Eubacteriales bacterium]